MPFVYYLLFIIYTGGVLWLGNTLARLGPKAASMGGWYVGLSRLYPLMLLYAVLFNAVPLVRKGMLEWDNKGIRQRNLNRLQWFRRLRGADTESESEESVERGQVRGRGGGVETFIKIKTKKDKKDDEEETTLRKKLFLARKEGQRRQQKLQDGTPEIIFKSSSSNAERDEERDEEEWIKYEKDRMKD